MRELDDTDLRILELLLDDARRPYSEIAEEVGVSPPTVSDRVDRLQEIGVVRRFTVDVDRSTLADGVAVLIDLHLAPSANGEVKRSLATLDAVEHVYETADQHVLVEAITDQQAVRPMLNDAIDLDQVDSYEVRLLTESTWNPHIGGDDLALACDQCGAGVDGDGEATRLDGELHHFCSAACRDEYEETLALQ